MTLARPGPPALGVLDGLLSDPSVTEVLINGGGRAFVERAGRLEPLVLALDEEGVRGLVERVIAPLGLRLDRSSPMVDARLPDGSRLHAVLAPVAVDGTCVAIRRFGAERLDLAAFGLTGGPAEFLTWAVRAGWNLLVAGGTGSGKTTLLNTLGSLIPHDQRIVTIEETAELCFGPPAGLRCSGQAQPDRPAGPDRPAEPRRPSQPHVVRLEARPANAEGAGAIPVRSLVRAALRLRPDRLIVGEVRGPEAFDMIQALNTGHDGSLCTIHANGPAGALARLESLILLAGQGLPLVAARQQIAASVDAVVHLTRHPDGRRTVAAISEVRPAPHTGPLPAARLTATPLFPPGVARPTRPPRRPGAPSWAEKWFACP